MMRKAVVLLSGGLDSATVLAMARAEGYACHALSFDYGQRHAAELAAARRVAAVLGAVEHKVVRLDLGALGGSALTDAAIPVPDATSPPGNERNIIPVTYVPARNTVFLAVALGYAEVLGATELFIGVNAVDYSGYPDCRPAFIDAFQTLAQVATRAAVEGTPMQVRAPLMRMGKAEIIRAGAALGVDYALTVSCYAADEEGRACGRCEACALRAAGFVEAQLADATRYRR